MTDTLAEMSSIAKQARCDADAMALAYEELDHRVNNALHLTLGLLDLQLRSTSDIAARSAIEGARARVNAVGVVHRIGSADTDCNLGDVLLAVCEDLVGSDCPFRIAVTCRDVIILPAKKTTLLALITSELVMNALKYAFSGMDDGHITVDLRRIDTDRAELCIHDDGVAFAMDDQPRARSGLGFNLVRGMAKQLNGQFAIDAKKKRFKITFPFQATN